MRSAVRRWNVITESPTTSGFVALSRRSTVSRTRSWTRIRSATDTRWWGSTLPAREPSAPFGMRVVIDDMCSNESGIDNSSTFMRGPALRLPSPEHSIPLPATMAERAQVGIIGGSGLYEIEGFSDAQEVSVETPFGSPSDHLRVGTLEGRRVAFLPRHGRGHRILPGELNFRANVFALKTLG